MISQQSVLMNMLIDAFTFFNENDVLAIRLEELAPVVDKFIIVQALETFRGNKKPDYFDYERFKPYMKQIQLVTIDRFPNFKYNANWEREYFQRNQLAHHFGPLYTGETLVMISDVDEIPRRAVLQNIKDHGVDERIRLSLDKYTYGINMLTHEGNTAVKITNLKDLRKTTPQRLRQHETQLTVEDAGWEFSSLGTPEHVLYKLKNFAHMEFDDENLTVENIRARMNRGEDVLGRDMVQEIVEIDDRFPEAVKNDRQYWSKYEW